MCWKNIIFKVNYIFIERIEFSPLQLSIKIGGEIITQERSAKLLGITFDDDLKWNSQIHGKGGLVSSLNQRLFGIRRLKNSLKYDGLRKVADSLFTSKMSLQEQKTHSLMTV